ncbi:DUF1467 family protein [Novosphingobium piscinae]|uniref:DUF1467 family protein n=1 Tax=Novosphingobium piscinae TaxID=1507448 RepID=A0A7X1KQC8_9SPHN|nr:DUF1467 family protein [Novosphingobium piscinae]MBC2669629.1 DUF1467 family protein [Novosphingobium piscinae]
MRWTSILAIYTLFWVLSAFLVLPFGVRTAEEDGAPRIAGQAESAPTSFSFKRLARRATLLSLALFALFYLNYVNGWIVAADLDVSRFYRGPART